MLVNQAVRRIYVDLFRAEQGKRAISRTQIGIETQAATQTEKQKYELFLGGFLVSEENRKNVWFYYPTQGDPYRLVSVCFSSFFSISLRSPSHPSPLLPSSLPLSRSFFVLWNTHPNFFTGSTDTVILYGPLPYCHYLCLSACLSLSSHSVWCVSACRSELRRSAVYICALDYLTAALPIKFHISGSRLYFSACS